MTDGEKAVEIAVLEHVLDMIQRGQSPEFIADFCKRRLTEIEKD